MKKLAIVNNITRAIHKAGFKFRKHSPEILIVSGVVGVTASAVMACKATMKLDTVLTEAKDKVEKIHSVVENPELLPKDAEYTVEDSKKDLRIVYAQTGVELVKLYGPSVVLGALSVTAILTSNNILRKRNLAMAAAYATVDKSFKEYRNRVVERFGADLDRELKYNIKTKEIEETVVKEDGTTETVKKSVEVIDPNTIDDHSRIFDCGNPGWDKNPHHTLLFLKSQQRYANEKLQAVGYLFLNEVYEMLGFPMTREGQMIGWIYDEKNPVGDNFVDFGLYDIHSPAGRDFINGYERAVLLQFNHDGNILDKM